MPVATAPHATRIAGFLVDWDGQTLVRPDHSIKLTPKAVAVLQLLLAEPARTVSRRAIFDAVWPGSYSSDDVLTQVVTELRRAFGDDARDARYIVTIPKLGYRWVGPTPEDAGESALASAPVQATLSEHEAPAPNATKTRGTVATLALVLVTLAALLAWRNWPRDLSPQSAATSANPATPTAALGPHGLYRQLTSERGLDLEPDLTSDGKRLVYVHVEGGKPHIRVRDVGATSYTAIDTSEDGSPSAPAWSPDGNTIAFVWRTDTSCEIRRVATSGGEAATIADGCPYTIPTSLDWSPAGDFLVYSRVAGQDGPVGSRNIAVFRVAPDGSALRQLSNARRWLVVDGHPRIDPDGASVVFVRDGDQKNRVFVVKADGSLAEQEVPVQFWPYRAAWAGDSLLVSAHGRTAAEIWRIGLDGEVLQPIALEAAGPGFAVTPDGAFAVFERRTTDDNIWRRPIDGDGAPVRMTHETGAEICPRISPDERSLAYLSDESGTRVVVIRDLATGARRHLASFAPSPALDLRWSPRGDFLAVIVGSSNGKRLVVLSTSGAALPLPERIASWTVTQAEWTHDQSHLLLSVAQEGRRELWRVGFPGLAQEELLLDVSVGWFSAARDSENVYLTMPRSDALEVMSASRATPSPTGARIKASPADQWTIREGRLAEMTQIESGSEAEVRLRTLDPTAQETSFRIAAPSPPLGRNIDLDATGLWYANRDVDEADLVRVDLVIPEKSDSPPPRHP